MSDDTITQDQYIAAFNFLMSMKPEHRRENMPYGLIAVPTRPVTQYANFYAPAWITHTTVRMTDVLLWMADNYRAMEKERDDAIKAGEVRRLLAMKLRSMLYGMGVASCDIPVKVDGEAGT